MSALKLRDKLDQVIFSKDGPFIKDIRNVYSHSNGILTGNIIIGSNKHKVTNINNTWSLR
jgi:hypothetical protein